MHEPPQAEHPDAEPSKPDHTPPGGGHGGTSLALVVVIVLVVSVFVVLHLAGVFGPGSH
jgi:hypothetical protein